jgi:tight adherence protein B
MSHGPSRTHRRSDAGRGLLVVLAALLLASTGTFAWAAAAVDASLSDIRSGAETVEATLIVRGEEELVVDQTSITGTLGGETVPVTPTPGAERPRSTMLVIDTSGSMGTAGMATVRAAVDEFLDGVPEDVKVGVVSFAKTSGVDVEPTTDRDAVREEVGALVSRGETALYAGVTDAVVGLGMEGERSIVLLSDGGDTMAKKQGGAAAERKARAAALSALTDAKVRAEVVAFKGDEDADRTVLEAFASAGGGSVASAEDRAAVAKSFAAAARALESQVALSITRPAGMTGVQELVVTGTASGQAFTARSNVDLGSSAPSLPPTPTPTGSAAVAPGGGSGSQEQSGWVLSGKIMLPLAILALFLGVFLLVAAILSPVFRSKRKERVATIDQYGLGSLRPTPRQQASPSALGEQLVQMGDRVMEGRESTTKTMQLLDRADLPWRAGEWFVLRILAVIVGAAVGLLLLGGRSWILGLVVGVVAGLVLPAMILRYLARRRARAFEFVLPDVLMLVATSLASGFSLLQALDAVSRDAPEPAAKEFSRALAETRIGADVSDALEHMADRMDSENMRWATMAIRIQREVGGNLAETLRTTAATLREREGLRRHVRALSAEGRISAYILIALPIVLLLWTTWTNYEYVSLLWTTLLGILMSIAGIIAMIIGVFWMRKVVQIEV